MKDGVRGHSSYVGRLAGWRKQLLTKHRSVLDQALQLACMLHYLNNALWNNIAGRSGHDCRWV